ncbi:bifunctional diguanylate cyclase/phosphodiesterase [Clostridioides difficile]|uniref:bifunctional diguanylate cyclase/phosphodiesterase n=1 Tax=Clostridioides difficile TaxID=1496 RepID=UPI001C16405C|nr:EAL domain-containing protein [Clostridioides difficile]MDF3815781.1 EAL domain-containing protein [Clostridioides difficile]HBF4285629.1 EAL domain-containing protein [Clostridioides difficile]HBF5049170.1 EAL domain-containing protein [Clostridioides difficile]HBF5113050.1 EAL domain-containing protein [Clostridioides difficile]HBF5875817.1 EAL domain-containing protein [Clostridioides difficile]
MKKREKVFDGLVFKHILILLILLVLIDLTSTIIYASNSMEITSRNMIEASKRELENYLEVNISLLKALSQDDRFSNGETSLIEKGKLLRPYQKEYNLFMIGITDTKGNVSSTYRENVNSIKDKPSFEKAIKTKQVVVSDIEVSNVTGDKVFIIYVPIIKNNEMIGTIFASFYFQDVNNLISRSNFDDSIKFLMIDKDYTIISHPNKKYVNDKSKILDLEGNIIGTTKSEILKNINKKCQGNFLSWDNWRLYNVKYTNIKWTNWTLVSKCNIFKNFKNLIVNFMIKLYFYIVIFMILWKLSNAKLIEQLKKLAYYDSLSGIKNKEKFRKDSMYILKNYYQDNFYLVQLDVNKFKYINEMFGYSEGNKILIHISQVLNNNTNKYEICARMDNDHFILLIACNTEDELLNRLSKINKEICNLITTNSSKYKIVMSSGIYKITKKDDIKKIDLLIDRANIAAKSKKEKYEHSYSFFNEDTRNRLYKEKQLEDNMNKALEKGEFIVYYQPKYSLGDVNEIEGAEALIRWNSPEFGFISPIDFIPLFEKNGFIVNIDMFVFEEVCKTLNKWINKGYTPVPISVNMSRVHLYRDNFIENITDLISKYNISPEFIELELTESVVFDNLNILIDIMKKIKEIGFLISMDDFGSGYSSLNLLKDLSFDILKLDRGFLIETTDTKRGKIIISKIVEMAKAIDIKVICEGVETYEQVEFLKEIGCDKVQGYLFAKPMVLDEFEKHLNFKFD